METALLPETKPLTKIIATIGPSSWDNSVLSQMIASGMTVARINASFADFAELERVLLQIREISEKVAVMIDAQGHKIRINKIAAPIELKENAQIKIGVKEGDGDVWVNYPGLLGDLKKGSRILLDDGTLVLEVSDIAALYAVCTVVVGGLLRPLKTVNLPGTHLSFPPLTEKDEDDISKAVELGFDFVAASFIRNVTDVAAVRKVIAGSKIKLVAKIENAEGVENFDSILGEVDAVMVARGDMGVELSAEKVPGIQKELIMKCREAGKPVVVATQMMESMTQNPRPTRAEVNDVANAVFDGVSAVMLSGETSTGKYPVEAVKWMSRVCLEAEKTRESEILYGQTSATVETDALARAVIEVTRDLPVRTIVVGTRSGNTVLSLMRHCPRLPIIAFVTDKQLMRQLNLVRGCLPVYVETQLPTGRDWLVRSIGSIGSAESSLKPEDLVVLMTGTGVSGKGRSSIVEVAKVFDLLNM
jgi:pyruvate kinase